MKLVEIECPYCGARFKVPETAGEATCPYCGAVFIVKKGLSEKVEQKHFYFPIDKRFDPYERLMRFLLRQYASPRDLWRLSSLTKRVLHYVPVYYFYAQVIGEVYGRSHQFGERIIRVEEITHVTIPVSKTFFDQLLYDYPFPLRGRRFFNPEIMKMGAYYEPKIDENEALEIAKTMVSERIKKEAAESIKNVFHFKPKVFQVEPRGLVHYPIWEIEYLYMGEKYRAFVDGSTGVVIRAEYPQTVKGRTLAFGAATMLFLSGLIGGIGYGVLTGDTQGAFIALLSGMLVGGAAALPAFSRSVTKKVTVTEIEERK